MGDRKRSFVGNLLPMTMVEANKKRNKLESYLSGDTSSFSYEDRVFAWLMPFLKKEIELFYQGGTGSLEVCLSKKSINYIDSKSWSYLIHIFRSEYEDSAIEGMVDHQGLDESFYSIVVKSELVPERVRNLFKRNKKDLSHLTIEDFLNERMYLHGRMGLAMGEIGLLLELAKASGKLTKSSRSGARGEGAEGFAQSLNTRNKSDNAKEQKGAVIYIEGLSFYDFVLNGSSIPPKLKSIFSRKRKEIPHKTIDDFLNDPKANEIYRALGIPRGKVEFLIEMAQEFKRANNVRKQKIGKNSRVRTHDSNTNSRSGKETKTGENVEELTFCDLVLKSSSTPERLKSIFLRKKEEIPHKNIDEFLNDPKTDEVYRALGIPKGKVVFLIELAQEFKRTGFIKRVVVKKKSEVRSKIPLKEIDELSSILKQFE